MPAIAPIPKKNLPKGKRYEKLVCLIADRINDTRKTGSQALNEARLKAYWDIGKSLSGFLAVAPNVYIATLSRDVQVTPTLLYRAAHFHNTWPEGLSTDARRLAWSKHILLFGLTDKGARDFYVRIAQERGWNFDALSRAIRNNSYAAAKAELPDTLLARDPDPLNVYKALLDAVIDGDTLAVRIDLGFHTWSSQRVRLRGINTSELAGPDRPSDDADKASRAKAYVSEKLQGVEFIVLKSYKTDIYGRYVADVFYHPIFGDKRDVALKGFFLNEELIREGLAERQME